MVSSSLRHSPADTHTCLWQSAVRADATFSLLQDCFCLLSVTTTKAITFSLSSPTSLPPNPEIGCFFDRRACVPVSPPLLCFSSYCSFLELQQGVLLEGVLVTEQTHKKWVPLQKKTVNLVLLFERSDTGNFSLKSSQLWVP